jgi:hypothetical protein
MTTAPRRRAKPGLRLRVQRGAPSLCLALCLLGAEASAKEVVASLPQTLYSGPPAGAATVEGVSWARTRSAEELPGGQTASIAWQRQLAEGISCNLLVDAGGSIFAAGVGRVTQLSANGVTEFSQPTDISAAVAAALLADGSRVVLSSQGQLRSWSPSGAARWRLDLGTSKRQSSGALLPSADGGLLVSGGHWLISLDADANVRARVKTKQPVQQTLMVGGQSVFVDQTGDVYAWNGYAPPTPSGSFGARVSAATESEDGTLVAIVADHSIVELSLATGALRQLARVDAPGLVPMLSVPSAGLIQAVRRDGTPFRVGEELALPSAPASPALPEPGAGLQLLGSRDGSLAWLPAQGSLQLRHGPRDKLELTEVRCSDPVSLVPAGPGRLAAACRSGSIWLVGPPTKGPADTSDPKSGTNSVRPNSH